MKNKKGPSIVLLIPAIIIGVALFDEFDFKNLRFEKPALAIVYIIGFTLSIIFLVKDSRKQTEN